MNHPLTYSEIKQKLQRIMELHGDFSVEVTIEDTPETHEWNVSCLIAYVDDLISSNGQDTSSVPVSPQGTAIKLLIESDWEDSVCVD